VKFSWEKEHHHLGNALAKLYTYAVDAAEEDPTMFLKSGVPRVAMAKQRQSGDTLGRLKTLTEKGSVKHC